MQVAATGDHAGDRLVGRRVELQRRVLEVEVRLIATAELQRSCATVVGPVKPWLEAKTSVPVPFFERSAVPVIGALKIV